MGVFSNLYIEIVEEYERLVPLYSHSSRIDIVAYRLNLQPKEVLAVIEDWIWGDLPVT